MNLCFLLCYILFIPLISSSNNTLMKIDNDDNKTKTTNKKTIPVMVRDGYKLPDSRTVVLPEDSPAIDLQTVDNELGTTKLKPIQPRKGVGNPLDEMTIPSVSKIPNNLNENKTLLEKPLKELNTSGTNLQITNNTIQGNIYNLTKDMVPTKLNNKVVLHKKPQILSYETLAKNDKITQNLGMIPSMQSSSNTLVSDQIPSPNRDIKSYKTATKYPGLVTPVVITILVVPVFAILGYMAFRRGHKAWKNRHYKRMDFLLDGMYNE